MTATPQQSRALTPAEHKLVALDQRLKREQFVGQLRSVLPKQIDPSAWTRTIVLAVTKNTALLNCSIESIARAGLQIAVWQLEIGRTAHIVPYGDDAQAQVDYKGMIELAMRGKSITSCSAEIVYERDEFRVVRGLNETLHHVPAWQDSERGQPIGAYAIVRFPSGDQLFDLMSRREIEKVRDDRSKAWKRQAGKRGPWESDPMEMWRKTVVRRLLKYVPQNPLLAQVLAYDEDETALTDAEVLNALRPQATGMTHGGVARADEYAESDPTLGALALPETTGGPTVASTQPSPQREPVRARGKQGQAAVKREEIHMGEKPAVPPPPATRDTYSDNTTQKEQRGQRVTELDDAAEDAALAREEIEQERSR